MAGFSGASGCHGQGSRAVNPRSAPKAPCQPWPCTTARLAVAVFSLRKSDPKAKELPNSVLVYGTVWVHPCQPTDISKAMYLQSQY